MPNETTQATSAPVPSAAPPTSFQTIDASPEPDLDAIAAKHVVPAGQPMYVNTPSVPQPKALDHIPEGLEQLASEREEPEAKEEEGQEEAPPPPPPPVTKKVTPVADDPKPAEKRERLAHSLRKERELREAETRIKAEEASIEDRGYQRALAELGADPAKVLGSAKLTPQDLARRLAKPEQAKQLDPTARKLAELEAQVRELTQERQVNKDQAAQAEMVQEIQSMVASDATRWPLIAQTGEHGAVVLELLDHYTKQGEALSDDEAADRVEGRLAQLRDKLVPQGKPSKSSQAKAGQRTVSNSAATSAPAPAARAALPADDDDAIEVIGARANRLLAEARAKRAS